jgi:RNA polymerase sigma factor (sigma-70 family)
MLLVYVRREFSSFLVFFGTFLMEYSSRVRLFEQISRKNNDFLVSVLWKLTGNREIFAEAFQYALLGIWRHVEKLDGKQAQSYIYRVALTANSKAWRNRIGKDGQITCEKQDSGNDPAERVSSYESHSNVRKAIADLPSKQARAIVMRYFEQRKYSEIAENLSCSEAGARSNVSKAIAALKRILSDE